MILRDAVFRDATIDRIVREGQNAEWALQDTVRGWTTIIVLLCLIGGLLLVSVGMVGEYTAKIYEEIKQRPLYLVDRTVNLSRDRNPAHARS